MTDDSLLPRTKAAPDRCKDGPATILVGVDGSTSSLRAAAYAAGLARRQRSRLVAVYVKQPSVYALPVAGAAGTVIAAQDQVERELRSAIEQRRPGPAGDAEEIMEQPALEPGGVLHADQHLGQDILEDPRRREQIGRPQFAQIGHPVSVTIKWTLLNKERSATEGHGHD